MSNLRRYKHSGAIGALAVPLGLLFGGATAVVGGLLYQLLVSWIPFIYINLVLTLGFGALLGALTGIGLKRGQLRNNVVAVALCALVGAGAVGVTHVVSYENTLRKVSAETGTSTAELRQQLTFEQFLAIKAKVGWKVGRSSSGAPLSGTFVYVIWGVEALIILGFAIYVGTSQVSEPYCEPCKTWTKEHKLPERADGSIATIRRDAEAGKIEDIVAKKDEGGDLVAYTVHACPSCSDSSFLTVDHVMLKRKAKGQIERKTDTVVKHAALTPQLRDQLLNPQPAPGSAAPGETPAETPSVTKTEQHT
ncbi:MAG: hypothetical protein U1A78_39005 [Polyangia bacterium]